MHTMILSFLPGSVQSLLRDVHYQYIQIIKFNKDVIMVILFSKSPPLQKKFQKAYLLYIQLRKQTQLF